MTKDKALEIVKSEARFAAPKSPEFGSTELTMIDDLSPEELQELEQHIKEIKERKRQANE